MPDQEFLAKLQAENARLFRGRTDVYPVPDLRPYADGAEAVIARAVGAMESIVGSGGVIANDGLPAIPLRRKAS